MNRIVGSTWSLLALGCSSAANAPSAPSAIQQADRPAEKPPELASSAPASRPDSDKPWKIDEPHGPTQTIAFDAEEGTWIALDVHPDGKRLVLSLLGDLYMLPLEGGDATRITSGPAYDVQPRFSPDGKWIAFASDRNGTENLWICDLEGKNARAITTEKEALVTGPAWSPDGDYIAGVKGLSDTSGFGTDLWLWHVKGGQGIALTKNDKIPQVEDASFSKDGRFVYFGKRATGFKYDLNVNDGAWQVARFDRVTSQVVPFTNEFGGAATPRLSPDGKTIAFVRRIRAKTVLQLYEVGSGKIRTLAEGLSRDNMEGFCQHGAFPGYAWTPDGRSIVATAGGRIWRFDAESGARTPVPFRAHVEETVAEALRVPQKLGGESVRARILRWPVESNDGKWLVFSALGHLYRMAMPGGPPERLTTLDDLEFSPAFSPDGASLTFVTWNDSKGGAVWTAPFSGGSIGTPRRLTEVPGQYANPSFSPDGKRVVYLKSSGATFRDNDLGDELWHEVHWSPFEGGESHYVIGTESRGASRHMTRPTFSADGARIYFVEDEPPEKRRESPKTVLLSVKLDGTDRRPHLRFKYADEAAVSPDGRWVVFSELFNAYVTPLPLAGKDVVDVTTEGGPLPVAQLTDDGGEWVQFADGGRIVTWVYGSRYHRLALDKAFPQPGDGDQEKDGESQKKDKDSEKKEKKALPKSDEVEITLLVPRARPTGSTLYTGARVVTMKGDEVIERGDVLVENDRIAAVGPAGSIAAPAGAKSVSLAGKTIIPGFIDEHAHLHSATLDVLPQRPWRYLANLAYGVTTTHDPSATNDEVFTQSEMVDAGLVTGPRVFSTGFILYGLDIPGRAILKNLDDARRHVRRMKSLGAFSVKSYMQRRREQRQWILQAAREEGIMVVPEGGGDLEMDLTMILDGHTTVEHALPITPLYTDVTQLFGRSHTSYTPTLLVAYGGLWGEKWFYQHNEVWKNDRLLRYTPQGVIDRAARIRTVMATDEDWNHLATAASAKKVMEAGGRVCLGGHGQVQGLGPHWEVSAFVQGGMTPLQALRVATLFPAQTLGLDGDLGSIETGKLADFMVLARNPLENIENTDSIELIVKNGVAYTPEGLSRNL